MGRGLAWVWVASLLLACGARRETGQRWAGPVSLVLIHTADLHSHVFPEPTLINAADARRGLGQSGEVEAIGGLARIATLIAELRQQNEHTLYLDSGDLIEGTAAFTQFGGEPELRALSALHVDAVAVGNHDLAPGVADFLTKHRQFAGFPVLAANYAAPASGLGGALLPYVVLNAGGVRVGVIGVGNESSPAELSSANNPYGISLTPVAEAVQGAVDTLRPAVDLIVAITHLGLQGDEAMIRATSGLDVVLGGHQHLTIDSALERFDCGPALRAERGCHARRVVLVHSGAFGRYVGRVELSLAPAGTSGTSGTREASEGLEVVSATHSLLPVSARVEEDSAVAALLDPYRVALASAGFDTPVAFALGPVPRYGAHGGDSALGNLVADAIRARAGSDVALLNTTGIRADLPPGSLAKAAFVSALPFGDRLTVLRLTGIQLSALFERQAQLTSGRDCQSPFQGAGFALTIGCHSGASTHLEQLRVGGRALSATGTYSLVTTDYLADNGAGFEAALRSAQRIELQLDPLDVLLDAVSQRPTCGSPALPCLAPDTLADGRIVIDPG
jgi:5'-nucleotidase/UDP-sugar diphosphatase